MKDRRNGELGDRAMYKGTPVRSINRSISVIHIVAHDGIRQTWLADRSLIADCIVRVRMED